MREKMGEMPCPNCKQILSIWRSKADTGFCSCGYCGFRGFNINPSPNPETSADATRAQPEALSEEDIIVAEVIE